MDRVLSRATALVALLALAFGGLAVVGASAQATTATAVDWLETQQQADGGFEVAGFPGFETADATFALASHAQTGGSWSTTQARNAVLAVQTPAHLTALNELDNLADGSVNAGRAAKLIVLVTNPLGLDPNAFDPDCDGGPGVDLQAQLGSPGSGGTYGISVAALNQILFAARATKALGGTVAAATVTVIRNAQRPDGSYAFNGSATDDPLDPFDSSDVDTTANAVQAMVAAGLTPGDATLDAAISWVLTQRNAGTGAFEAFGADDPNSTAVAMLALHAVSATTYASQLTAGDAFLLSQQHPTDHHIISPNDFGAPSTFATSQSIQALDRKTVPAGGVSGVSACTDGNLDGISDADQPAVETVPAAIGAGYITIETLGGGASLMNVEAVDPASKPAPPAGVTLPNGLVTFEVHGVTTGGTVTVQVRLHDGSTPTHYYKLHDDGTWHDFTSHATFAGSIVTLTLTDGGAGDDDPADGVILDPGGPASVTAQAAAPLSPAAAVGTSSALDFTG
jgi:hypothetical protein